MTMRPIRGERTLMRIFIGESDTRDGKLLYEVLLNYLRNEGIAGATVLRAIAGFGASSVVHTSKLLRMSTDLPIVVEVIDETERIEAILGEVDRLVDGGLITLERADVIVHRPHDNGASAAED